MARNFIRANSERLEFTSGSIISGTPFSMAAWFRLPTLSPGGELGIISVGDSVVTNNYHTLQLVDSDDRLYASTRDGVLGNAISASAVVIDTWFHGLGVWTSATSRQVYLNGVAGTENTDNLAPTVDQAVIGAILRHNGFISHHNGDIAEPAMWSVALSSADAAQLPLVSPLMVRPDALLAYWPLHGRTSPEIDVFGGNNLTLINTPATADHPPIIKRSTQGLQFPPVAAVGGRIMSSLARHGGLVYKGGIAGKFGGLAG